MLILIMYGPIKWNFVLAGDDITRATRSRLDFDCLIITPILYLKWSRLVLYFEDCFDLTHRTKITVARRQFFFLY